MTNTIKQLLNNDTQDKTILNLLTASTASFSDIPFNNFCLDSRQVQNDDIFVLFTSHSGDNEKSAGYVLQVIEKVAFVLSEIAINKLIKIHPDLFAYQHKLFHTPDIRCYLGDVIQAKIQYQCTEKNQHTEQSQHNTASTLPKVLAVTGTNGKTTISQLVAQLTKLSGYDSAVMGTAGNGKLGQLVQATHTTTDVLSVHNFLQQMANENAQVLCLEASSHGLEQQRLQGVPIEVAVYTNLSRDHLDYHKDMANYAEAKARLFDRRYFPQLTHAIINLDDDYADTMLAVAGNTDAHGGIENIWTYTLDANKLATFVVKSIKPSLAGAEIELVTDFGTLWLQSPLLGKFNIANLVASVAGAMALDINIRDMAKLVPHLKGADGRMDRVVSDTGCFIVDYAHTPDALIQVLTSLKQHCTGELWAVFGCGGDRDRGKRPLMAQAGLNYADKVILTADNPRSEDPEQILHDMQEGMSAEQYTISHIEADRKKAINYAVQHAKPDDIVVVAGKGHEAYQEIKGVRYDFDDRVVLTEAIQGLN